MTEVTPTTPSSPISQPIAPSPWWLFVLVGILIGYIIFRPGGARDYFLTFLAAGGYSRGPWEREFDRSGLMESEMQISPRLGQATVPNGGGGPGFSRDRRADADLEWENTRTFPGGAEIIEDPIKENDLSGTFGRTRRDREISLPPTDLFGDTGKNPPKSPFRANPFE